MVRTTGVLGHEVADKSGEKEECWWKKKGGFVLNMDSEECRRLKGRKLKASYVNWYCVLSIASLLGFALSVPQQYRKISNVILPC